MGANAESFSKLGITKSERDILVWWDLLTHCFQNLILNELSIMAREIISIESF